MPSSDAFMPIIVGTTGTQMDCTQVTTATASASTQIKGNEVLVKCLTNPCYIRLGRTGSAAVSSSNGYYMAVGDELKLRVTSSNLLYYIRSGGTDGALSIAFGTGD